MQPTQSPAEAESRHTFLALMWSLSRPGKRHMLPTDARGDELRYFSAIGRALLDLETSFYTADAMLAERLSHTGAKRHDPARAAYHFYPHLYPDDLAAIEHAPLGDYLYPDRGATLVIGCQFDERAGLPMQLNGPGVLNQSPESCIQVSGIPAAFWELRARRLRYPLGFDLYLLSEQTVIGIPRTTQIELEAVPCM